MGRLVDGAAQADIAAAAAAAAAAPLETTYANGRLPAGGETLTYELMWVGWMIAGHEI